MTQPDDTRPDDARTDRAGADGTAGAPGTSAEKDPSDWVTGDEPATGPQQSYLGTLAREAGTDVPDDITKARASELIDDLQSRTGRGQ